MRHVAWRFTALDKEEVAIVYLSRNCPNRSVKSLASWRAVLTFAREEQGKQRKKLVLNHALSRFGTSRYKSSDLGLSGSEEIVSIAIRRAIL